MPEGLLDDDPRARRATRRRELLDHQPEQQRRDRQVVRRPLGRAELPAERLEGRGVRVVAVDVAQQARELLEGRRVEPAVLLEAVAGAGLELFEIPAGLGDPDHRNVEVAALQHRLQRREDLLVGEVARRPEEHQRVRVGRGHGRPWFPGFSTCPPNWKRMAESSLSW